MIQSHDKFNERLTLLSEKHARMSNGYVASVRSDGLIVVRPRRARIAFPLRGLALLTVGFFVFKAFILAAIGPVTYNERLANLQAGNTLERAGAWVLQIDPLTDAIAGLTGPVLR